VSEDRAEAPMTLNRQPYWFHGSLEPNDRRPH
jgi:hypothetical protein